MNRGARTLVAKRRVPVRLVWSVAGVLVSGLMMTACAGSSSAADKADHAACSALLVYSNTSFTGIPTSEQAPLVYSNLRMASRKAHDSDLRAVARELVTSLEVGPNQDTRAAARCLDLGVNLNART